MILIVCATVFTYKNWIDILPFLAGIIYAFACWQKNIPLYRWLGILVSTIYIIYDAWFNSIFGVVSELIAILCAVIGLILELVKKHKKQSTNVVTAK